MKRKIAEGWRRTLMEYGILTGATVILNVGIYFFKFPNNFTFGGVSGLSVLVSAKTPLSAGTVNLLVNAVLLVLGFIFLGRDFGIKTVYVTVLNSMSLRVMEMICPMTQPLTGSALLELIFATLLPAVSAALLFNIGASSGGTDIVARFSKSTANQYRYGALAGGYDHYGGGFLHFRYGHGPLFRIGPAAQIVGDRQRD